MPRKTERKNTDLVGRTLQDLAPGLNPAPHDVPCHIVRETHAGIRVEMPYGHVYLYRCQMHWWARVLFGDPSDAAVIPTEALAHLKAFDFGPQRGGPQENAITLAYAMEMAVTAWRESQTAHGDTESNPAAAPGLIPEPELPAETPAPAPVVAPDDGDEARAERLLDEATTIIADGRAGAGVSTALDFDIFCDRDVVAHPAVMVLHDESGGAIAYLCRGYWVTRAFGADIGDLIHSTDFEVARQAIRGLHKSTSEQDLGPARLHEMDVAAVLVNRVARSLT